MLTITLIMSAVFTIVSLYFIGTLAQVVANLPLSIRFKLWNWLFTGRAKIIIALILNFIVSSIIMIFTGTGMTAGLSNLLSSILVGYLVKYVLRKYEPKQIVTN